MPHSNLFKRVIPLLLVISLVAISIGPSASAQSTLSTVIPYQGQLTDGGSPANSQYDFEFKLFDAASAGNQIGATSTKDNVQVTNGLFAVELDFGGSAFNGASRFLAIGVRAGTSTGAFTALTPRRPLLAVPYALYSPSGSKPAYGMAANAPNNAAYAAANGNVGIGTTNPQTKLHINGNVTASDLSLAGPDFVFLPTDRGDGGRALMHDNGDVLRINYGGEFSGGTSIGTGVGVFGPIHMSGPEFLIYPSTRGDGGRALMHDNGDVLRINYNGEFSGGTSIAGPLSVNGIIGMSGPDFKLGDDKRALVYLKESNVLKINYNTDYSGGTHVDGLLYVNGPMSVNGTMKANIVQITGGDLAEPFEMAKPDEIQPGMVVTIDPTNEGQLKLARNAYDRTVAGVVSGAGGINAGVLMYQDGASEDTHNVALSGRVYVYADATNGAILPGDLLTTASTPGHAMKVTDHAKAQGAILGKAMGTLEKGKGLVLMLVSLQ